MMKGDGLVIVLFSIRAMFATMFATVIDRLGDRNPQFLREIKGRLKWRNLIIAVGLSLLAQVLILIAFMGQLPASFNPEHAAMATVPELNIRFEPPPQVVDPQADASATPRLLIEDVYGFPAETPLDARPQAGDVIIAIDGVSVAEFDGSWQKARTALDGVASQLASSEKIRSLANSIVKLHIERDGQRFDLQMTRAVVTDYYNSYCWLSNYERSNRGDCVLQANGQSYRVDWPAWCRDFFRVLSIVMAVALLSAGSFLLIQNITQEQRRGTLTFVRLSPRSALTVLGGQILGTPMLAYLAIALCLPAHIGLGLVGGFNFWELGIFYSFLLINCGLFFSLALLYGLLSQGLSGFQGWLYSGALLGSQLIFGTQLATGDWWHSGTQDWLALFTPLVALHYIFGFEGMQLPREYGLSNYTLSFAGAPLAFGLFCLLFVAHGLVWSLWVWHGLRRKFINPQTSLINRPVSYLLTVCFEVFLLNFANNSTDPEVVLNMVSFLNLLYFIVLMATLQPTLQGMADWARFRHSQPKRQRTSRLQDWLLHNQSPPTVAIALNLILALGMIATWLGLSGVLDPSGGLGSLGILGNYAACASLLLIYSAINQLIFLSRSRQPSLWAMVTLGLAVVVPLFCLGVFYGAHYVTTATYTQLLIAPWIVSLNGDLSVGLRLLGLLGQWSALVICSGIAARQLKHLGASQSQAALAGSLSAMTLRSQKPQARDQ